jgi:hypothetical protein
MQTSAAQIIAMARAHGISIAGKPLAAVIREIQRAEGNFDCFGKARGSCDQRGCLFRSLCLGPASSTGAVRPRPRSGFYSTTHLLRGLG